MSCKHLKSVLKFSASGHVQELLSYLSALFKTSNLDVSNSDRIHLSNLALMAYFQQALASEASSLDAIRLKIKSFLDHNHWFDECLAVRLAAETREWTLLGHLACSRGLHGEMLTAIAAAFGHLLALESDNVKHLQDSMTKMLHEMPMSERQGLVQCLVHQKDNLATCLAYPALGEQILRVLIGLLPLLEQQDLSAVIEQCRPDRPVFTPILWPLMKAKRPLSAAADNNNDSNELFALMLINFYITVQLLVLKKTKAGPSKNCDPSLVKLLIINEVNPIGVNPIRVNPIGVNPLLKDPRQLGPLVKIRAKVNLMAAGYAHVLLVRPVSGQLLSWGTSQFGVLSHVTSMASARFAPPKPVDFFNSLSAASTSKGHTRLTVISVACGRSHSMALTDCGVYVWGSSKNGQLGLGPKILMAKKPTLVSALAKSAIVGLSAGHYHSACLDEKGHAWTWGWGVHGQLGQNSIEDEYWPQRLLIKDRVLSVACGYAHTVVLTIKGQVWTFGCGLFGQLGIGEVKKVTVPSLVPDLCGIGMISCGYFHTQACDNMGEQLYMWGCNPQVLRLEAQQQKKNSMLTRSLLAADAEAQDELGEAVKKMEAVANEAAELLHLVPTLIDTSLFKVADLACGNQHSLILTSSGSVLAFGRNLDGQLGIGSRKEAKLPTLVAGLKDDMIVQIASGGDYSLALSETGSMFAWGNNSGGQLGKPPMDETNLNKDCTNSKVLVMKSTKRIIRYR
jgi:alpha-tubulin suppressor-like RCC1 family protein